MDWLLMHLCRESIGSWVQSRSGRRVGRGTLMVQVLAWRSCETLLVINLLEIDRRLIGSWHTRLENGNIWLVMVQAEKYKLQVLS